MKHRQVVATRAYPDLRTFLDVEGKDQMWLARELGVSQSEVSKWVRRVKNPRADRLVELHTITQVPLEALLKND